MSSRATRGGMWGSMIVLVSRVRSSAAQFVTQELRPMATTEKALASVALLLVAWLNSGLASPLVSVVPGAVRWGLFGVWLGIAGFRDRDFRRSLISTAWPVVALITYSLIAPLWGAEGLERYHYGFSYLLVVFSLWVYYSRTSFRPVRIVLIAFLVLDTAVVGVTTWFALNTNSGISRILATADGTRELLLGDSPYYFVGSYTYAYVLGVIAVLLAVVLLRVRGMRWWVGALLVVIWVLLVKMSFAIAVLIALVITSTVFVVRSARVRGWGVTALFSVLATGALCGVAVALANGPAELSRFSPALRARLSELAQILAGGSVEGSSAEGRLSLYRESLVTFFHHPLLGVSANPGSAHASGAHSEWLDMLAVFGLFALLFAVFLVKAYRLTRARLGSTARPILVASWTYFLILGLVNPLLFAHILVAWFLAVPIAAGLLAELFATRREDKPTGTRPRILVIHHSGALGGGTKSLKDVLATLSPAYDVVVCAPEDPPSLSAVVRASSCEFLPATLPFPLFNHYNGGSRILSRTFLGAGLQILKTRGAWTRLIRSQKPDLVIVNSAVLAPLGPAIKAAGVTSLCFVRETFPRGSWLSRTRFLLRYIDREFDAVVFLSHYDQQHAALMVAASQVVRDSFSAASVASVSRVDACSSLGVPADSFNILFVGGASHIKGLDVALRALEALLPRDIHLIAAGDMTAILDPAKPTPVQLLADRRVTRFMTEVEGLLALPSVASRTTMVGLLPDVSLGYAAADAVIFPSTSPHQARPVFEAGANGLPIVISEFPETAEIVTHNVNGLTFAPGDANDLAEQILKLYQNPQLVRDLGEANRVSAIRDHNLETQGPRLLDFVHAIVRPDDGDHRVVGRES